MGTRRLSVLILPLLLGCATRGSPAALAPGAPGYIKPSQSTVLTGMRSSANSQVIYVQNNSSAVVVVTSVTITDCVNVTPCGFLPLHDRVEPNQQRQVEIIRPASRDERSSFNYKWTWTVATSR